MVRITRPPHVGPPDPSTAAKEDPTSGGTGHRIIQIPVSEPGRSAARPESLRRLAEAVSAADAEGADLLLLRPGEGAPFGMGLDLNLLRRAGGRAEAYLHPVQEAAAVLLETLAGCSASTLAWIRGPALGVSLTVALACDMRVAVEGESTLMGYPELPLGLLPAAGGVALLARVVGPVRAAEMLLSGRRVTPPEAARLGIVDFAVPVGADVNVVAGKVLHQGARPLRRLRMRPRRHPQGRTWADWILEGTPPGRRWLMIRLGRRLEESGLEEELRVPLLESLTEAMQVPLTRATERAAQRAARAAIAVPAEEALGHLTMREWARRGGAGSGTPQEAARALSGALYREALLLLGEGARPAAVDGTARALGMGPGPFSLMDREGLARVVLLVRERIESLPDPETDGDLLPLLEALIGRDVEGPLRFYRYGSRARTPDPHVFEVVERVRGVGLSPWDSDRHLRAAERCWLAVAAEASRGIDERHPAWLWDLTAITVLEWRPTGGGPLRRIDREGIPPTRTEGVVRLTVDLPPGGRFFQEWPLPVGFPPRPSPMGAPSDV